MKHSLLSKLVVLMMAGLLFSCIHSTQPDTIIGGAILSATQEVFTESETVELVLKNQSSADLYLEYCGPNMSFSHQIWDGENWVNFNSPICQMIYAPQYIIVLEPGKTKIIKPRYYEVGLNRYILPYKLGSETAEEKVLSVEFLVE